MKLDVFSQFTPFDLTKASKDGETYKIEGIASSEAIDESGEIIKQEGLDWSYCLKTGAFNLDHKNDPKYILGAPTEVYNTEINGVKATGIKGILYASKQIVKDVFETATAMKSSGVRKMGFSIEGKVIARDPRNPRIITKAKVLNVSITGNPCNQTATIEMIKNIMGNMSEDEKTEFLSEENNMKKSDAYADVPMSYDQSKLLVEYSQKMVELLGGMPEDLDLPEWVQSKITRAVDYMQAAYHYLDIEMKEEMMARGYMDKMQEDKPMPKVEEGDDEGATQTPSAPGIHPTMDEDNDYRTQDKPEGYPVVSKEEGSMAPLAEESLEGKKDEDEDDDESMDGSMDGEELASEDYDLSDAELRQLVMRILKEYPELSDKKVMALIHDIMARKACEYKKK